MIHFSSDPGRIGIRLAALAISLFVAACAQPRAGSSAGLEVAIVADPGPATIEMSDARDGAPSTVHVEDLQAFRVESASVATDPHVGNVAISFELVPSDAERFEAWTAARVGRPMAILVNRRVLTVATLQSALPGSGIITGGASGFSPAEAQRIVHELEAR